MSRIYRRLLAIGRRFFAATGIPIPTWLHRAHVGVRHRLGEDHRRDVAAELDALAQAVARLEAQAYVDSLGRRDPE